MATPSKVTNVISKKPMATPSKAANGVNETSETPSVKRRMETPVYPSAVGSKTPGQNGKFSQPCKLFQASYTPQANQKSLTPLRKTPTTFSQPLSVKKFSRRLCKTSDQNPDHPLSKYATLIDSEDTHYPIVSSQSDLQEQVIHGGSKSVILVATKDNPSFDVNAQHVQVSSTGMFGPTPSKSIGRFGNTSSIATEVTSDSLFTSSLNEVGLPQSPLVSRTAPLPLHQSNVDVAATFRVSLSTVVLLDLVNLMVRGTCLVIRLLCIRRLVEEVLIHSIDDVTTLFGLSLNSLKDINEFTKDLKVGKNALWLELAEETRSGISDIICDRWNTLLNLQKSALIVDDNLFSKVSPSDPIINGRWILDCLKKLTRIPIWVKLHDVPIQVFEEDDISLIATFIGKPVMLDSYTSSMCNDLWDRSSFARRLIEVNLKADLVDVVNIGIPSLTGDGFTKETICVEYEWRPSRCDILGKKKKRKNKSKSTNVGQFAAPSVKQSVRYEPKVTTSAPTKGTTNVGNASTSSSMLKTTGTSSKKYNISTSNSFSALNDDEEDEDEGVENVYDE
ncbi:zinc knuckle CX2CX4HX4C containing protein [Tanacetum coccineum]